MGALLSTFLPGWRLWGALALLGALAGGLAWWRHDIAARATTELRADIATAQAQRRAEVAEYVLDMSARNAALVSELLLERGRVKTETRYLKQKVTDYVTPLADSRCIVPRGFVLHFDAAWSGRGAALPGSAGGLVDEPSGIPLSRVEDVVTDNAGACHELLVEVRSWRRWYPEHKTHYDVRAARWNAQSRGAAGEPEALPATKGR